MNEDKMKLKEAIEEMQEKVEALNGHIKNYEKSDCKTATYFELVKEKEAIETVLQELRELQIENIKLKMEQFRNTEKPYEELKQRLQELLEGK